MKIFFWKTLINRGMFLPDYVSRTAGGPPSVKIGKGEISQLIYQVIKRGEDISSKLIDPSEEILPEDLCY